MTLKVVAICRKCGREFLTLGSNKVTHDPYKPQGTLTKRLPITPICNGKLVVAVND